MENPKAPRDINVFLIGCIIICHEFPFIVCFFVDRKIHSVLTFSRVGVLYVPQIYFLVKSNLSIADISFYIEKSMRDLYVDDSTNSFDEVHECQRFFEISKTCLAAANFNLRKWATNNSDLRNVINNASHTDEEQGNSEHENIRKVLGLNWDLDNDTFIFEFNEILQTARSLPITKRNILKIGGMFFDPLGLLSPLTLKAKLLFQ